MDPLKPYCQVMTVRNGPKNSSYDPFKPRNPDDIVHPLLQYGNVRGILQHINDYPTLIILTKVCHTYRDFIHSRPKLLELAYRRLEHYRVDGNDYRPYTNRLQFDDKKRCCSGKKSLSHGKKLRLQHCDCVYEHDIFRYDCGQLRSLEWAPCYGCNQIRRVTDFFPGEIKGRFPLMHPTAWERRCARCLIRQPSEEWFQKPYAYINHMPRGFPGFRLRCIRCKWISWVPERPGKRQLRKMLCATCFEEPQTVVVPEAREIFWDEWRRLLKIKTENIVEMAVEQRLIKGDEQEGERKIILDLTMRKEDEEIILDLPRGFQHGFEALSVDAD